MIKLSVFLLFANIVFSQNFPNDYFGIYKGKLNIVSNAKKQEIDMEFHLSKTDFKDKFHYTIIYTAAENKVEKKYTLVEIDKEKGLYYIDENNYILLNAFFSNNTLYSIFEVEGSVLTTTEKFTAEYMDFEIMSTKKDKALKSGGTDIDIPEVISYPVEVVQTARLFKTTI